MELILDDMRLEDVSGVALVEEECFSKPWSYHAFVQELSHPGAVTLIALSDREIIGFINAHFFGDEGNINNIAVTARCRRQGVGRKLLEALIARAQAAGIRHLYLEVRKSNRAAIGCYENMGFFPTGERRNFYDAPTEDALLMQKDL